MNKQYIIFSKIDQLEAIKHILASKLVADFKLTSLAVPEPKPKSLAYKVEISDKDKQNLTADIFSNLELDFFCLSKEFSIKLALFDMDSTLIQAEVMDELARFYGVYEQVSAITESAMRGEIDFKQSFTQRLAKLKGMPTADLAKIRSSIKFTPNVEILFEHLNKFAVESVLVSGGFDYFASNFAERLKIKEYHANILQARDNKLTGEAVLPILDSNFKERLLQQKQTDLNLTKNQIMAVGDGANDIPMLLRSGIGVAYKAKPLVQQKANFKLNYNDLDALAYLLYI